MAHTVHINPNEHDQNQQRQRFSNSNHHLQICLILGIFLLLPILTQALYQYGDFKGGSQRCGMNAFWSNCATTCPDTCQNYGSFRACTLMCRQGCTCNKGYVLVSSRSSRCVPISQCPSRFRNGSYNPRNWSNNNYNHYYG